MRVNQCIIYLKPQSTIRLRAQEWWSEWTSETSEFPIKFNIKLRCITLRKRIKSSSTFASAVYKRFYYPKGEQTLSHIPEKLLITRAIIIYQLSFNKYNKACLNTNLAKTLNLFTRVPGIASNISLRNMLLHVLRNFFTSLAFILFACENMIFYT